MKRNTMKIASLCLIVLLLSSLATAALAAPKPQLLMRTFWAGEQTWGFQIEDMPEGAKIVSVKSSNPKVLKAYSGSSSDNLLFFDPLKPGKSKVTVTIKDGSKTSTLSAVYTVKKFPSTIATLKVNGKAIKHAESKNVFFVRNYKPTETTVTFKPKKGWSVTYSYVCIDYEEPVDIKSDKSFNIPKGKNADVVIGMMDTKTKEDIVYFIYFIR